jgi:hypothetical protein
MAIDRAPWNALIDDDGSNLIGTVWNKDKIKTVILDPVDAALLAQPSGLQQTITVTTTGVVNDWTIPGLAGKNTVVDFNGAADFVATGLVGGVAGQLVTIRNRSAFLVTFQNDHSGSAAANRFVNQVTSAGTPIAPRGVAQYIYMSGAWYLVAHDQGAWITPPFNAAEYSATGGSWTVAAGHVSNMGYRLQGRTLAIQMSVNGSTIGGTPSALARNIPGGFVCARAFNSWMAGYNAAERNGMCNSSVAGGIISMFAVPSGGAWAAGTANVWIHPVLEVT